MTVALTPELMRKADQVLDRDEQRRRAHELGQHLFQQFPSDEQGHVSTQVRNLQRVAVSATRLADIEDFVKQQMGRGKGPQKEWCQVGGKVLEQLQGLREAANGLATEEGQRLALRLYLARAWVRAVIGAYLYAKAQKEMRA